MSKRRWSKLFVVLKYGFVWSCLAARPIKIRVRKQLSKVAKEMLKCCIWAHQRAVRLSHAMTAMRHRFSKTM